MNTIYHYLLQLWFDVGIKRYTTAYELKAKGWQLWFDVGIKRYTTEMNIPHDVGSCGLM